MALELLQVPPTSSSNLAITTVSGRSSASHSVPASARQPRTGAGTKGAIASASISARAACPAGSGGSRSELSVTSPDSSSSTPSARSATRDQADAARTTLPAGAARSATATRRAGADRQQLPAAVDAANECDLELAGRDPDARAQPQPHVRRLEREPGLHRAHGCLGQALLVVGLPAAEERVAGGGEEVAAVPVHDLGQLHEVLVQRPRELVEAFGADAAQFLDARGPALDVGEQQRPMDR